MFYHYLNVVAPYLGVCYLGFIIGLWVGGMPRPNSDDVARYTSEP